MTATLTAIPAVTRNAFADAIAAVLGKMDSRLRLDSLKQLSGGASQELWLIAADNAEMVLRRAPGGDSGKRDDAIGLVAEAGVMRAASAHGVPVPEILHVLEPEDGLGTGFLMRRVHGETVARKIFRDERFAAVRPLLARACGEILGRVAQVPLDQCPSLQAWPARVRLDDARRIYLAQGHRRPVFDYAFRWLYERLPSAPADLRLVHGDFRNGNLIIDESGIAAVLDWEIAHFGAPMEDLGWLCIPSWRYGRVDQVAGGFGSVEQLIEGFEAAGGGAVDRDELHFWMVLGVLQWGLVCVRTALEFRAGRFAVEPAVIGRRASETELDLLMLTGAKDGKLL